MKHKAISHRLIEIPSVGLGSTVFWYGNPEAEKAMAETVQDGLISMIDCAEMYGNGRCEEAVGRVLRKVGRENVYLVDKILPDNATPSGFCRSLETSLRRLGTDYLDLYLLHWREKADLAFVAEAMTAAVHDGVIRNWGVSNFDVADMEDLFACEHGNECFADQVLYNIGERGIEFDLLPWLNEHNVLPMSYSSLGSSYTGVRKKCGSDPRICRICQETGISTEALMLAFNIRGENLSALFSSSSYDHIRDTLRGLDFDINPYLELIDKSFPAPDHKVKLAKL